MTQVEQYFRSYFAEPEDETAFYLAYSVTVEKRDKKYWILDVRDHAGKSYQGCDYPCSIIFRLDKKYGDFADIYFFTVQNSIVVRHNQGLPTQPLWISTSRPV